MEEFNQKIEKLVKVQKLVDARLNELYWSLNISDSIIPNMQDYIDRLYEIRESLALGLCSDTTQTNTKIQAVYSLYEDVIVEISKLPTVSTTKSVEDFA